MCSRPRQALRGRPLSNCVRQRLPNSVYQQCDLYVLLQKCNSRTNFLTLCSRCFKVTHTLHLMISAKLSSASVCFLKSNSITRHYRIHPHLSKRVFIVNINLVKFSLSSSAHSLLSQFLPFCNHISLIFAISARSFIGSFNNRLPFAATHHLGAQFLAMWCAFIRVDGNGIH